MIKKLINYQMMGLAVKGSEREEKGERAKPPPPPWPVLGLETRWRVLRHAANEVMNRACDLRAQ